MYEQHSNIEIGLCTIAFRDSDLLDVLSQAKKVGYDGVEIWGREKGHLPPNSDPNRVESVRQYCEQAGLKIFAYGSYLRLDSKSFAEEMAPNLKITNLLSTNGIRVWSGFGPSKSIQDDEVWELAISRLRDLGEEAEKLGITVMIENHDETLTDCSQSVLRLLEGAGWAENVATYYQPLAYPGHEDPYVMLENIGPYVRGVHAQNMKMDTREITPIESGDVDFGRVFKMLSEASFRGPVEVEFLAGDDRIGQSQRDYLFLHSLREAQQ